MLIRNLSFALLVLFCACQSRAIPNRPSKDLVVAVSLPIGEIKPFSARSGISANIIELLYRPLFKIGGHGEVIPDLAKSVHWDSEEQKDLRVNFDSDLAADVKNTVEQAQTLKGGDLAEGLRSLQSVEISSSKEVVFHLSKFDRAFQILLSQIPIVAFSSANSETGEFFVSSQGEDEVVLERREKSPDKINRIRLQVIPSPRRAIRELVAGNVDLLFFALQNEYDVLKDLPEIKVEELSTRLLFQVLDNRNSNIRNVPIDWGLLKSRLDPDSLSNEVGLSEGALPNVPVPKGDPWYDETFDAKDDAKKTEEVSMVKQERSLSFLGEQARDRRIARVLKRYFSSVGIVAKLVDLSPEEFSRSVFQDKSFDLILLPFNIKDTLISNYLVFHSPNGPFSLNFSNYNNAQVDSNLDEARYARDDGLARQAFAKAMLAMRENPPGLFLFWLKTPIVYRQSCSGFKFSSNEFFSSLKDVRCEPSVAN